MAYRVYYNSPESNPADFETLTGSGGAFETFTFDLSGHLPITDVEVQDLDAADNRRVHAYDTTGQPAYGHVIITVPSGLGEAHNLTSDGSIKNKIAFFLTAEF